MQPQPAGKARQEPAPSSPTGNLKLYATAAALGLLALLLFVHQYTTMARFGVFPPGITFGTPSNFLSESFKHIGFSSLDYSLLAAIACLFLALVIAEFRGGCFSALLRAAFTSEFRTITLLTICGIVAVRFYLGSGEFPWGGDQQQHICFAHMASRSISEGELPIWTNYLGAGTPYLQFYGFLFFYFVALIDQLWNDVFTSLKVAMGVLHAASGVAMYLLARTLTRSRKAGFIAGLAYVLSFWHTQQIIIMGRFPLSLFYALLPLPFYFFERMWSPGITKNRERLADSLAGGICLGALVLTHPGYGFWATVLLGVFVGLRLLLKIPFSERPGLVGWSAVLFAGGLILGGYLTLPMWLEREHTALYRGMLDLSGIPLPTWQQVLSWSNYRFLGAAATRSAPQLVRRISRTVARRCRRLRHGHRSRQPLSRADPPVFARPLLSGVDGPPRIRIPMVAVSVPSHREDDGSRPLPAVHRLLSRPCRGPGGSSADDPSAAQALEGSGFDADFVRHCN